MIDLSWLELLVAVVLPIAVAVVTQEVRSSNVKAIALAALTTATTVVTAVIDDGGVFTEATLRMGVDYFLVAVASYYGFWKHTGVTSAVARKTDSLHIGV